MKKLAFLLLSLITTLAYAIEDHHYTIVIDAGSSGSRLHIFQYTKKDLPEIKEVFFEEGQSGIASYHEMPEKVGHSLKKILDDATLFLEKKGVDTSAVAVNLFATAGMRLLPKEKQKAIYLQLNKYLQAHYSFRQLSLKTISGKMEALYGWLNINYELGNFQNRRPTVGSIDMGGASTQIAFATSETSSGKDEIEINIDNQHYIVFTKSFLGLGQDQALNQMHKHSAASACYPTNYELDRSRVGHFNMQACSGIYADLLKNHQVAQALPPILGQIFYAYSGIYYTYHFFNVDERPDQFNLRMQIQNICNFTWTQLQNKHPYVGEKYLATYCANAIYFDQLLNHVYKINDSKLIVANKINEKTIDWTLGAVLFDLI